jgi:hypothetical protein
MDEVSGNVAGQAKSHWSEYVHWRSKRQSGQLAASRARFQRTLGEKTTNEADFAKRGAAR